MIENTETGALENFNFEHLQKHVPELQNFTFRIDTYQFDPPMDSSDMDPDAWRKLVRIISDNYERYTGFVILHGTDTMAYTASALSFMLEGLNKPVILTGAQQPISNEITDAKKNLRDSVVCAIDPGSRGVMVVFGGHVIAGTRAKKNKTISYDAFASVNFPELALVQGDRLVRYIPSPWPTGPVEFSRTLDSRVFLLKLTPGMSPALIPEIFRLYDCVIVESFGVGGIPSYDGNDFLSVLEEGIQGGKTVVLTTQVQNEGSNLSVYDVGFHLKNDLHLLEAYDMTTEAVVAKLMWILGQTRDPAEIRRLFCTPVSYDLLYLKREDKA